MRIEISGLITIEVYRRSRNLQFLGW